MIQRDERLDRTLREQIGVTSTFTEDELDNIGTIDEPEDPDHEELLQKVSDVIEQFDEELGTRRAVVKTDAKEACFVGVHVLVRDYIHVLAWLRASDIDNYRDGDIRFLNTFGKRVRDELDMDIPLTVHVFTSSLHEVVNNAK